MRFEKLTTFDIALMWFIICCMAAIGIGATSNFSTARRAHINLQDTAGPYGIDFWDTEANLDTGTDPRAYIRYTEGAGMETYALVTSPNDGWKLSVWDSVAAAATAYITAYDGGVTRLTFHEAAQFDKAFTGVGGSHTAVQTQRVASTTDALNVENTSDSNNISISLHGGGYVDFLEYAAPGNPSAGDTRCYAKTGASGDLCCRDSAGTETCMSSGAGGGFTDIDTDYGNETVTSTWTINDIGLGDLTEIDFTVGNSANYGMQQIGDAVFGRTSHTASDGAPTYNLNGAFIFQNATGPVTGDIEFGFLDSSGLIRFGLPKSGVGNATYNSRSMFIAGPAVADSDIVTLAYWQGTGIFDNIDADTSGTGADLGVQDDVEVEGSLFIDTISESTTTSGVTIDGLLVKDSGIPQAAVTVHEAAIDHDNLLNHVASQHLVWSNSVGTIHAGNVGAAHIDAITEIASGLKAGADLTLLTGTSGTSGHCAQWNGDGDLVTSGAACGGGGGSDVKSGQINVTEGSPGTVTFNTAFSGTPWCTCTLESAGTDATCWISTAASTTAVSFAVDNSTGGSGNYDVNWICTDAGDP